MLTQVGCVRTWHGVLLPCPYYHRFLDAVACVHHGIEVVCWIRVVSQWCTDCATNENAEQGHGTDTIFSAESKTCETFNKGQL